MIILGRYGDKFTENLFEEMKKYKEDVSYHEYSYKIFSNDEPLIRFTNGTYLAITSKGSMETDPAIRFRPGASKLRDGIKNDPNILLVIRGASGYKWKPTHEVLNGWFGSKYLKEEMGAEKVNLVIPHIPFGKQDHIFYDDEEMIDGAPITLKYARELLKNYADLLISFNPHDFRDKTGWIKKDETTIPGATKDEKGRILDKNGRIYLPKAEDWTGFAYAINAMPLLAEYVISSLNNPIIIGPDRSVERIVEEIAEKKGLGKIVADKIRDKNESLNVTTNVIISDDMSDKDAVIFDDLIGAGTTGRNIIIKLKEHPKPPRSITFVAVNGEFVYNRKLEKSAYDILKETGAKLIVTDTIETPVSKVSVVPLLAEELYKLKV